LGSTLLVIRNLLASQIYAESVTDGSDPSKTLLNTYINEAIRVITRRERPRELLTDTPIDVSIVAGANSVSIPSTSFIPESVYYKDSGGRFRELKQKSYKDMIQIEGSNFFETDNSGDPIYYSIRGTSIILNKYFSRSEAAAIKIIGIDQPTTLSADGDTTELPTDYDMLIVYESALLYAERDDDDQNITRWTRLSLLKRAELRTDLRTNDNNQVAMDPNVFSSRTTSIGNPSIFFGP